MSKSMNQPVDTRSRALKLGNHFLQTRGYNGFSFQDIADSLDIRKASLHYYFASKEDLGIALIEQHHNYFRSFVAKNIKVSSFVKLEKLVHLFYTMAKDHKKACPLGVLCLEYHSLSKNVHNALSEFHATERKWLIKTFKEGIAKKEFRKNLDATMAADVILASIQGGLQLARLQRNAAGFRRSLKGLLKSFKNK